jgi:hypothetical protein
LIKLLIQQGFECHPIELPEAPHASCNVCQDNGTILIKLTPKLHGYYDTPSIVQVLFSGNYIGPSMKSLPCPCCNLDAFLYLLWSLSGLEQHERLLKPDYIARLPGKDHVARRVHDFLSQIPFLTGLLILFGLYGVGKTGQLKSIVASCIQAGVPALYITAGRLLSRIQATYNSQSPETEDQILTRINSYQLLALDEVDKISNTDWSRSKLFEIINQRYTRRLQVATLLAMNMDPLQMGAGWEYLESRMKDGERIPMGGCDLRGRHTD